MELYLQIDEIEELKKRHLEFHWVQNLSYRLTRLKHGLVILALNYAKTKNNKNNINNNNKKQNKNSNNDNDNISAITDLILTNL